MADKRTGTSRYLEVEDKPTVVTQASNTVGAPPTRRNMDRTPSMAIQAEKEDLKEAAQQSSTVILDLNLDGKVRWVSQSWEDVIGTPRDSIQDKSVSEILLHDKDTFRNAVEEMKGDDSRSYMLRFAARSGPLSKLPKDPIDTPMSPEDPQAQADAQERILTLEAQGILVNDRATGEPSHTMWVLRPFVERSPTAFDLPAVLVESLGVGATMLANYLAVLTEEGTADPENHPPPMPVLCRICERPIPPWWFEKHSELCLLEHQAESDVQMAQDNLSVHRHAIVKVLDAMERQQSTRAVPGDSNSTNSTTVEYRGYAIGPLSSSSSGSASPNITPSRSRDSSASGIRPRSFIQRRPLVRIVELLLDLCDTALEISTPAIKECPGTSELRTQSPLSESRIQQVFGWQSPSTNTLEQEHGLALLCADTEAAARAKVDAVIRHQRTIEYSERIRSELENLVENCIDEARAKAEEDMGDAIIEEEEEEEEGGEEDTNSCREDSEPEDDTNFFPGSFSQSLSGKLGENRSETSIAAKIVQHSSPANSEGANSPQECPTPKSQHSLRSRAGDPLGSLGRRHGRYSQRSSMIFDTEAGDSDTSVISSLAPTTHATTESPGSETELSVVRSGSMREKRRSIYQPGSPRRQASPARIVTSSSPLRIQKPRIQSLFDNTSLPLLSTTGDSPAIEGFHHRRQSSAASSEAMMTRPPLSPRLSSVNPTQQRAVQPSIKDFEIIKPISKGAFGSVYLSKKKNTGDYFAIKVLKKADMIAKNQVTNVRAERAIMMIQGESDFVAKLFWTFQSKDYLYLVMEYLNGGDCAALIKQLGGLPEEWAKRYLAEVILGLENLHGRGIVHRDLKPDNLLIDQKGHLKLTDFGLSRMGLLGRQKRAQQTQSSESTPDLLKQGPFAKARSLNSSRSTSFDFPGGSPSQTPLITPENHPQLIAPSYFNLTREGTLSREHSRRSSIPRSDTPGSESLMSMLSSFSLNDTPAVATSTPKRSAMEEDARSESSTSSDLSGLGLQHVNTNSSQSQSQIQPPTQPIVPPSMALFDPDDNNRKFVGTPDYLAPETIHGTGQDEMSDWWSLGCILFEFLFGYPPFHAEVPEQVFENILARRIDWLPDEDDDDPYCTPEAKDLMNRLMCTDPSHRLGANGAEEIKKHPWFSDLKWDKLLEEEPSFIPTPQDPEDTEYFDSRGATLQSFSDEFEDQVHSTTASTPGADLPDRPHDAVSVSRKESGGSKRGLIPLHIPWHVREGRNRRLSEPVNNDDFGSFAFKNLPVLEKANKDVIQRLRTEALKAPTVTAGPASPMESSPNSCTKPLSRALSASSKSKRSVSPSGLSGQTQTPTSTSSRGSQPSSPLLMSFTPGPGGSSDRKKTSSNASTLSLQSSVSAQAGAPMEVPRLATTFSTLSSASASTSPVKHTSKPLESLSTSPVRTHTKQLSQSTNSSPAKIAGMVGRSRSVTVGSQDSDHAVLDDLRLKQKRRSQVFDMSPSSSENEENRSSALLRVQKRRQSSRRMSSISVSDGPVYRPLDVLVCEDHPVSRMVMERMLEKLRCRTIAVDNGSEAMRYAMGEVKFDIILMEFRLPQISGEDVARMIRTSQNTNSTTPIIAVTGYLKDLMQPHHFDTLVEKPMTFSRLTEILGTFCMWKPPPPERPGLGERRDSLSHHKCEEPKKRPEVKVDVKESPKVDKAVNLRRGSSLGQMFSYTDDDSDLSTQKPDPPPPIPRTVNTEWDSLGLKEPTTSQPIVGKASPKHLEPPGAFMHRPNIAPALPSQASNETAPASIIPPLTSTTGQTHPTPIVTPSSPEKKPKRQSPEKRYSKHETDVEDADDELSKQKKPSKSRSISDFTARIKRVSAEMKRSKSNISE